MARLRFPGRPGHRFGRLSVNYKSNTDKLKPDGMPSVAENVQARLKFFSDTFGLSDEEDETFLGFSNLDIKKARAVCKKVKEKQNEMEPRVAEPRRGKRTVVRRSYAHMIRHGFSPSEKTEKVKTTEMTDPKYDDNTSSTSSDVATTTSSSSSELCPIGKLKIRIDRGGKKARIISNSSNTSSSDDQDSLSKKKVETVVAKKLLEKAKRNAEKKPAKLEENLIEPSKDVDTDNSKNLFRRKTFVLPVRSARSKRLIIPRKRLMEEFDCSTLQVARRPPEEELPKTRSVAATATPEESDVKRPSLKVRMKITGGNYVPETVVTTDGDGNLIKKIEKDISKYADTMARKVKVNKLKSHKSLAQSSPSSTSGVEGNSNGFGTGVREEVANGAGEDRVKAKIEKMLRSQWDGRLRKPNGKRSSDEEIAASKQRASTQRRTKNILRKARLQLNKRTLMKLRQPASVRKLSEQFLKDQSEVQSSVKLSRFPMVALEPMDVFLKQTKNTGGTCGVCGQSSNFCLVTESCGQMSCEYCLKFYTSVIKNHEELKCECEGNCVMKPNILGQSVNCKYCWFQGCLKIFKPEASTSTATSDLNSSPNENTQPTETPKVNGSETANTTVRKASKVFVKKRRRGRPKIKIEKKSPSESMPPADEATTSPSSERGPRIKHVCRRASVVLGFPRATFPTSPSIGMAHKALKKAKRIKAGVSQVKKKKEIVEEAEVEDEITVDLTDKDWEEEEDEQKLKKKRKRSSGSNKRKLRCKKCANCTRKDCGKCLYCMDMRKFGGNQVLKQCCKHRKCLNPVYNKEKRSEKNNNTDLSSSTIAKRTTGKEFEGSRVLSTSKKAGLPNCPLAGEMMDGDELRPPALTGNEAKKRKSQIARNVFLSRPVKQKEKEKAVCSRSMLGEVFNGASIRARQVSSINHNSSLVPDGSKNNVFVDVDFWEDYDPVEIWNCGRVLIASKPFPIRIVCFLCGSGGQYEMIYCILCCEAFHRFCLEAEDVPLAENVENWCCRRCQLCGFCGEKTPDLLKCHKCQNTYHAKCQNNLHFKNKIPNYPSQPSKKKNVWLCIKCLKCKSCDSTSFTTTSDIHWVFDHSVCLDCCRLTEKGNYCPLCEKCYEDDDYISKMVQCIKCQSWIHAKCDEMTDEMYECLTYMAEIVYVCRKCAPEQPPSWRVAVEKELQSGLNLIMQTLVSSKCAKHLIRCRTKGKLNTENPAMGILTSSRESPVKSEGTISALDFTCPESETEEKSTNQSSQEESVDDLIDTDLLSDCLPSTELFTDINLDKNTEFGLEQTNLLDKNQVVDFEFNMGFSSLESSLETSQKDKTLEESVRDCIKLMDNDVMTALDEQLSLVNGASDVENTTGTSSHVGTIQKLTSCQNESSRGVDWTEVDRFLLKKSKHKRGKNISFQFKENQPSDFLMIQDFIKKGRYLSISSFCEDVIRVIRLCGVAGKKGNTRTIKTIFVRQMEKLFPWFAVTSPSLWGQHNINDRLVPDSVVPPNCLDHNYAQCQDVELEEFDQLSLFTVASPNYVMDEFGDSRWCVLCSDVGDGEPDEVGRLLYCGQDDWIHLNCAVWSAEVFQEVDGSLQNVHAAITRGRMMKCEHCGHPGATVGCCLNGCRSNFHFMCARASKAVFQEDKKVYCFTHQNKANKDLLNKDFTVSHSVYIDLDKMFSKWAKKTWQKGLPPSAIHILAGCLMVEQLGKLSSLSDTEDTLIPVDYQCSRVYWSTQNPRRRVVYTLKTVEVRPEITEEVELIEHVTTVHELSSPGLDESIDSDATVLLEDEKEPIVPSVPNKEPQEMENYLELEEMLKDLCMRIEADEKESKKGEVISNKSENKIVEDAETKSIDDCLNGQVKLNEIIPKKIEDQIAAKTANTRKTKENFKLFPQIRSETQDLIRDVLTRVEAEEAAEKERNKDDEKSNMEMLNDLFRQIETDENEAKKGEIISNKSENKIVDDAEIDDFLFGRLKVNKVEPKEIEDQITAQTANTQKTEDNFKLFPQNKSETKDLLLDVLMRVEAEEAAEEERNKDDEKSKMEISPKTVQNGRKNSCAENLVLLTPLSKKKLTEIKLTTPSQRGMGRKIRKNWGLEPLKKYPVRSTRYKAELVEPVVNGRKFKVKKEIESSNENCNGGDELITSRLRRLPGRRCWSQDSVLNGKIKKNNLRSKENKLRNVVVDLVNSPVKETKNVENGNPERDNQTSNKIETDSKAPTLAQKSCAVKVKRMPSILSVRKVSLNFVDGCGDAGGDGNDQGFISMDDEPSIAEDVVTVEGKNGTTYCITRTVGAGVAHSKKKCALNQDDNHNIVEPLEVVENKGDGDVDSCRQSNGFCSNETPVDVSMNGGNGSTNLEASRQSLPTPESNRTSTGVASKPTTDGATGPFKCNKCRCLYRTMESCQRHMAICNFEVETTSSEDESSSPKSVASSSGKRRPSPVQEESTNKKFKRLFESNDEMSTSVGKFEKSTNVQPQPEVEIVSIAMSPLSTSFDTDMSTSFSSLTPSPAKEPLRVEKLNLPARPIPVRRLLLPKPSPQHQQQRQPEQPQQQQHHHPQQQQQHHHPQQQQQQQHQMISQPSSSTFSQPQVIQVPMGTPLMFSMNDLNTVTPLETVVEPLHMTYLGSVSVNQGQQLTPMSLSLPSVMPLPYTVVDNSNLLQSCLAQGSPWDSSPLQLHVMGQPMTSSPVVGHQFDAGVLATHQQFQPMSSVQTVQVANEQLATLLSRGLVDTTRPAPRPGVVKRKTPVPFVRKLQNIAPKTNAVQARNANPPSTSTSADVGNVVVGESTPLLALYQQEEKNRALVNAGVIQQQQQPHILYQISSEDGFFVQTQNVNDAWKAVAEKVQDARAAAKLKYVPVDGLNGVNMSGFGQNAVQYILEQMPQAKTCQKYRFRFHEQEIIEEVPENPSGCARSEVFHTRKEYDMFNFLASKHRKPPEGRNGPEEEEMQHKSSRRATSMDLPMAMRFRHLRQTAREAVGVYRSKIHGRGLFCKRCIDVGEMVIEYAGEVIRSVLTDMREKYYESKGIGCYMFRIDDNEVVDATMHGNAARFINHSCEPNCYSKVITVDGKKHIIIFALRRINRGEELTYDYKFPIEDVKIPCTCGSRRCRKYLN